MLARFQWTHKWRWFILIRTSVIDVVLFLDVSDQRLLKVHAARRVVTRVEAEKLALFILLTARRFRRW